MPPRPATRSQFGLVVGAVAVQTVAVGALVLAFGPVALFSLVLIVPAVGVLAARRRARRFRGVAAAVGAGYLAFGVVLAFFGGLVLWPGALVLLAAGALPTVGYRERRSAAAAVGTIAAWTLLLAAAGLVVVFAGAQ